MMVVKRGIHVNGPNSHSVGPHVVRNDIVETNRSVMLVPGSLYLVRESAEDNETDIINQMWHRPVPGPDRVGYVQLAKNYVADASPRYQNLSQAR